MNGFRSELRRLTSRRAPRVLLALVVLGFVIAGVVVFATTSEPSTLATQIGGRGPGRYAGFFRLTEFLNILEETSGLLMTVFLVIGATAMGGEWAQRSITASLTYEPRRAVLLGSKIAAVVIVSFLAAVALQLLLSLLLLPTVLAKGTTAGADASWWLDYLQVLLRVGFLATFTAALGFSIATVGRNTAASLGVVFVYIAVLEPLLRSWKQEWAPWFVFDNVAAVSLGKAQMIGFPPVKGPGPGEAVLLLTFYGMLIFVGALAIFRRRDVA